MNGGSAPLNAGALRSGAAPGATLALKHTHHRRHSAVHVAYAVAGASAQREASVEGAVAAATSC